MFIGGARGLPSRGPAPRPRPALPPALPAPRGTPTYRPGQSVNNAAVQRYEPAPVRAAQHQAAQRGAYVAAPHHYGPVTPPVNVRRSTVNTTRSPAHATTQRLAKAIGQPRPQMTPARTALTRLRMQEFGGRDRAFMLPNDPITHGNTEQIIGGKLATMGQFNQTFQNLLHAGLLPKGAKQPPLIFSTHGANGTRADGRSYEKNGKVFLSPTERADVGASTWPGSSGTWAKETLVHELAHTLQSPKTMGSVPAREGGAQAYTDAATPAALGPLPTNLDSNYTGYVNKARKRGSRWIMQGQFGPQSLEGQFTARRK